MGDILRHNWTFYDIPRSVLGYNGAEFINFSITTPNLQPGSVFVFLTDSSEIYDARGLGPIQKSMKIPDVIYPPDAKVIVTAKNKNGQRVEFQGPLKRGSSYVIDQDMAGNHRLNGAISTGSCCSYNSPY